MSRRQRKIAALERRADRLDERVAGYRPDGDPNRARAELSALRWALAIIAAAESEGVLDRLEEILEASPTRR